MWSMTNVPSIPEIYREEYCQTTQQCQQRQPTRATAKFPEMIFFSSFLLLHPLFDIVRTNNWTSSSCVEHFWDGCISFRQVLSLGIADMVWKVVSLVGLKIVALKDVFIVVMNDVLFCNWIRRKFKGCFSSSSEV